MAAVVLTGQLLGFGLLGAVVRFLDRKRIRVRCLTDASYWMYLAHLPLLVLLGILLADLGWSVLVKPLVMWVVITAVLLIAYELLVRRTQLDAWPNGKRYPRRTR